MAINFTFEEFMEMVEKYNTSWWPLQLFVYALAFAAILFALKKTRYSDRIVLGILAFFWVWIGIFFNYIYFSKLFHSAIVFAFLFVIQGGIFAMMGVLESNLSFHFSRDVYGIFGGIFILYAIAGYPAIEYLSGRGYPYILTFGLTPCPTTIFTLGMLLLSQNRLPIYVFVIPVLYAISGFVPIYLGVIEDIGLVIAGLSTAILILRRNKIFDKR